MPMKNPPHPGDLIRTEIIEAIGLNVSKAVDVLKVRRTTTLRVQQQVGGQATFRSGPDG